MGATSTDVVLLTADKNAYRKEKGIVSYAKPENKRQLTEWHHRRSPQKIQANCLNSEGYGTEKIHSLLILCKVEPQ